MADKNKTAGDFLRRAAEIMEERGKQYDRPEGERSMGRGVTAFNAITGRDLTEAEGWLLLQIIKDVRQWQRPGFHLDSAEDCIAYSALKAEAKQKEAENIGPVQTGAASGESDGLWAGVWAEPLEAQPQKYSHLLEWIGCVAGGERGGGACSAAGVVGPASGDWRDGQSTFGGRASVGSVHWHAKHM